MIDAGKNEIWDRQPGETAQWYNRFTRYRLMGLSRSIRKVFEAENRRSKNLPGNWLRVAEKWNWRERAEAWDFAEIEMQRVKNEEIFRNELQAHYENCLIMSREGLAATHRLLNLANAKFSILEKKAEAGEDVLHVRDLPMEQWPLKAKRWCLMCAIYWGNLRAKIDGWRLGCFLLYRSLVQVLPFLKWAIHSIKVIYQLKRLKKAQKGWREKE